MSPRGRIFIITDDDDDAVYTGAVSAFVVVVVVAFAIAATDLAEAYERAPA